MSTENTLDNLKNSVENTVISIFNSHIEAEEAVKALHKQGFDMENLSIIGKGYQTEEHPVGFYTKGDRIKTWGSVGAIWGGIWGLLFAPAVFFIPGVGLVALAGPIVTSLVAAMESSVIMAGLSALGAALFSMGMKEDEIIKYEKALIADKFVLILHGTEEETAQARQLLNTMKNEQIIP
ncbi:MAG: DUF1269 domain-containing protein [Methylovulum sp.]|uniref:DUF1269 domain-containing protein n=1 Tax=Methylovulum sp. TaxID=1916980 RepID=UPI00262BF420|nr:DUF1269 domain-containing protein [Methylovulum sp.]MDD2723019.1 DUF1269 domain-containing protein [Methylovulum sp.]MDD5124761.1 DUF1269 domain-containing protein [Methylovulum sp.]